MPKHQVQIKIKHRAMEIKLTVNSLQLISDALEIVNPDTEEQTTVARDLAESFRALFEYVKEGRVRRA